MLILGYILGGLATVLGIVLTMLMWIVIARAVISWVNPDPSNPIVRFLDASTEPFLRPLRRFSPLVGGGIDLTPIVLLLAIIFIKQVLVGLLMRYSVVLGAGPVY